MAGRKKQGIHPLYKILFCLLLLMVIGGFVRRYPALLLIPVAVGLFFLLRLAWRQRQEKRLYLQEVTREETIGSLIARFHEHPHAFEEYIAELFEFYGFDTEVTVGSNDGGKDIIMTKDDETYVVEVKLYAIYNKISREKLQKLHSAMWDMEADHAVFVTTSDFTSAAAEFAERNGIRLINGEQLVELLEERRNAYLS